MTKRQERLARLAAVAREHLTAAVAVSLLEERLRAEPSFLRIFELGKPDARNFRDHLEATYLIRLYAEFESGLRDAWRNAFQRDTHPPMRDLIIAIAARRPMSQDWIEEVHEVRLCRNAIVHEGEKEATFVPINEAERRLSRFFSRLPFDW